MIKKMTFRGFALTTVSLLAMPQMAWADEAASDEEDPNIIIVEATRDGRELKDVPMSINVATGDQLEKLRILDVKDVQQLAPGLELSNFSGRNNTATLRGMSFDPDQGTSPSVQVFVNEVPVDAQAAFTAIYDIQQIEVLRGPQGVLRGQGAPAGSMLITTRRPSFDRAEGYFQATVTDLEGYNVQAGVSVPISDKIAFRIAGLADGNRINHVRNLTRGGERAKGHTVSGRLTLGFKPADGIEAYLTYQHLEADNNQFQQVAGAGNTPISNYTTGPAAFGLDTTPSVFIPVAFGGGPFPVNTTIRSGPALTASDYSAVSDGVYRVKLNQDMLNFNLKWDLGAVTLGMIASHQRDVVDTLRDQDLGNALPGLMRNNPVHVPYVVDVQELRLSSNNDEGFGWGVGIYHSKQGGLVTNDSVNDLYLYNVSPSALVNAPCAFGFPGCPGNFTPYSVPNTLPLNVFVNVPLDIENWSFNANLRYFAGPLKIEGGIRYSIRENNQTTQIGLSGFRNQPYTEVIPAALQKSKAKPWTGGVNISYELSDTLNAYASYGRAFRAPTTGVSTPVGITADLIRTDSETTDSFEVGLKGSLMDRRLNFALAGFYQQFNGFIRRFDGIYWRSSTDASQQGFFSFNYNGDAKIKGVEAELNGRITDNWDFGLSAAYAHARFDNARLPCNDFAGTGVPNQNGAPVVQGYNAGTNSPNVSYCVSSGRLAEAPDFSLTANTEIRFPMGNVTPFVRALFTHRPGFFSDQVNFQYESRQLLNLFVGVRGADDKWSIDVFARNLLNQSKITNISLGNATIAAAVSGSFNSGYRLVNVTNPREFGVTAAFKF